MSTQSPQLLSRANIAFKNSLEASFRATPAFDSYPVMKERWDEIGSTLISELNNDSSDSVLYFRRSLDSLKFALTKIEKLEAQYSDFEGNLTLHHISVQKNVLKFHEKLSHSFLWLYKKNRILKNPVKKVKAIRDWLKKLNDDVLPFLHEREFPRPVISEIAGLLENCCNPEILSVLQDAVVKNKREKADLEDLMSSIYSYSHRLQDFCTHLKELAPVIPFEIEGKIIYLSPDSAEGKALQRIENPVPNEEWITIVEEDQEIDVEGALKRLRNRGYKVKVPSQS